VSYRPGSGSFRGHSPQHPAAADASSARAADWGSITVDLLWTASPVDRSPDPGRKEKKGSLRQRKPAKDAAPVFKKDAPSISLKTLSPPAE